MKSKPRSQHTTPQRPAPDQAMLDELDAAVELVLGRSDALLATDSAPSAPLEAIARALAEAAEQLARLDEVHKARVVEVRRLRDLLRDHVLVAVRSASLVIKTRSREVEIEQDRAARSEAELAAEREQLARLRAELVDRSSAFDALREERDGAGARVQQLEAGLQSAREEAARLEAQLGAALGHASEAGIALAEATQRAEAAAAARDRATDELARLEQEREHDRAVASEAARQAARRIEDLTGRLGEAQAQAQRAEADAQALRTQVEQVREQHDGFIVSLTEEYEEKLAAAQRQAREAAQGQADAAARVDEISVQVEVLSSQCDEAKQSARQAVEAQRATHKALQRAQADRDEAREQHEQVLRERDEAREQHEQVLRERDEALAAVDAAREREAELERLVSERRHAESHETAPTPPVDATALVARLRADLDLARQEVQLAMSERDAAITDALRVQKQLDAMRASAGADAEQPIPERSSVMPAPLEPESSPEDLRRTADRLERERDQAMHTLAELRAELTQAQRDNRRLRALIGFVDDAQLLLPVDDPGYAPAAWSEPPGPSSSRARRSKPPAEEERRSSSYFVSGDAVPEDAVDGRARRGTEPADPEAGKRRRRTRPK